MRILIIRPGAIGDALLAFHILKLLKAQYAHSHITFVSNASVLPLAKAFGLAEEVSDYAHSSWSELFSTEGMRIPAMRDMLQQTDLAICWLRDPDSLVERNLLKAGVQHVIVAPGRPPEGERIHIVDYLATTIGLQNVESNKKLSNIRGGEGDVEGMGGPVWSPIVGTPYPLTNRITPPTDDHTGPPYLSQPPSPLRTLGTAYVAIHPGSGSAGKCWPAHNFTAVIEHLIEHNIPVLLLAGPADAERVKDMLDHLSSQCASGMLKVLENVPLLEVAEHLQWCMGYLGNDSGITHLAAMLGVPTLALFGPTDPLTWRPVGPSVSVIQEYQLDRLDVNMAIETMNSFYLNESVESNRTSGMGTVHNIEASGILDSRQTENY